MAQHVSRHRLAPLGNLAVVACLVAGACAATTTPSGSDSSVGPTTVATPATEPTPGLTAAASDAPSAEACELGEAISTEWEPLPREIGRCFAGVSDLRVSFEAAAGWSWASLGFGFALSRDASPTRMTFYGYGGAVVPRYCEDPPPTEELAAGSAIVGWLDSVEGLETLLVGRSVGPNPAWQLDLRVSGAPACSPGKEGRVSLWTIEGQPVELPESLGEGEQLRAYLVETPDGILIATVEGELGAYEPFLLEAEMIFGTLGIE